MEEEYAHADSGRKYHLLKQPPKQGLRDDVDGEAITQGYDDHGTIGLVLKTFKSISATAVNYFGRERVISVSATKREEDVVLGELVKKF